VLLFGRGRPNKGDQGPKILPEMANISVSGVVYCGETSKLLWRRLSAAAYGCALLLLVTFALDELAVSQATEHQNAPIKRLCL